MKFKCRMNDVVNMRDFQNIVTAISRMSKICILRLTENSLYFTVEDERAPSVWTELSQKHFFEKYNMVGASPEQNEIYLEFDATMLARSLGSLRMTAKSVDIKLTNKQQPCLTLEIELPSLSSQSRQCMHDVPVRVIPRREWSAYQAPNIPEFDISLDMPQLKHVRNVVDRLKNMSPHLTIMANDSGSLILKVETDWADVSTHFNNLNVWNSNESSVSANIDIKKLNMFTVWDIVHAENIKCNILHERLVNFHIIQDEYLTIQYMIPAIAT